VHSAVLRLLSSVRLSVRLSVTIRYRDDIGWNSSKITSPPNSLRTLLWLTPTWAIWCNGNMGKFGEIRGEVACWITKAAISLKRVKIEEKLLWRAYRGYFKNLGRPWIRPRSLFSQIFKGLLFTWILWIYQPSLKFVTLPVPEIIGGTHKIWAVPVNAHAPCSPKFLIGFCSDGPFKYICQIWRSYRDPFLR